LASLLVRQRETSEAFATRHEVYLVQYNAAAAEQGKHTNLIDEVTRLTKELQTAETILSKAKAAENGKANAEKTYDETVTKLDGLVAQRRKILKSAAVRLQISQAISSWRVCAGTICPRRICRRCISSSRPRSRSRLRRAVSTG
jgi:hypothetical protein